MPVNRILIYIVSLNTSVIQDEWKRRCCTTNPSNITLIRAILKNRKISRKRKYYRTGDATTPFWWQVATLYTP